MEKFFSIIAGFDSAADVNDFLYRRYNDIKSILEMDICDFADLVRIGKEKEREERIFQQWIQFLVPMSKKELKYISFEEYIDQCTGRNVDLRPAEDIIAEIEALHGIKI